MEAIIARDIVIVDENSEAHHFTASDEPVSVSEFVFRKLKKADALAKDEFPEIEPVYDDNGDPIDFEAMTKAELLEFAQQHGVECVTADMKKAEIIFGIKGELSDGE